MKQVLLVVLSGTMLSGTMLSGMAAEDKAVSRENEFRIACWTYYDFKDRVSDEKIIQEWIDLGINCPMTPAIDASTDKAEFRQFLDKCHRAGLRMTVNERRLCSGAACATIGKGKPEEYRANCRAVKAEYADHPAVRGFYIYDEPDKAHNHIAFTAVKIANEEIPGKTMLLNHLPNYENCHKHVGYPSYDAYLDDTVAKTGLKQLGFDVYTQMNPGVTGWPNFFDNLKRWSDFTVRTGVPYNLSLICSSHFNYVVDTKDDFRWQISAAVAAGAKEITWFFPDHHTGYHLNYRDAPINPLGDRTATFAMMGEECRLFQKEHGATMNGLVFERVCFAKTSRAGIPVLAGDRDMVKVGVAGKGEDSDALIGLFHDAKGVRYVAVVNLQRKRSQYLTLWFAKGVKPFCRDWGKWQRIDTGVDNGLKIANAAGVEEPTHRKTRPFSPGQLVLIRLER